jgi:hypothetical protein
VFDASGMSFVSVTQQFNTTTSMGRLTLNVLLSFAEFEREVTAERIRDKIAASKNKGMWMGGVVPLGYRVEDRKLLISEGEAVTVRWLFDRYLELRSVRALVEEAKAKGLTSRAPGAAMARSSLPIPLAAATSITYSRTRSMSAGSGIAIRCTMASIRRSFRSTSSSECSSFSSIRHLPSKAPPTGQSRISSLALCSMKPESG